MLRGEEPSLADMSNSRMKIIENGGTALANMFSTNLWKGEACIRKDCPTCKQNDDKKLNCFHSNIVYKSFCTICAPGDREEKSANRMKKVEMSTPGVYVGESSRSIYEHAKEHV